MININLGSIAYDANPALLPYVKKFFKDNKTMERLSGDMRKYFINLFSDDIADLSDTYKDIERQIEYDLSDFFYGLLNDIGDKIPNQAKMSFTSNDIIINSHKESMVNKKNLKSVKDASLSHVFGPGKVICHECGASETIYPSGLAVSAAFSQLKHKPGCSVADMSLNEARDEHKITIESSNKYASVSDMIDIIANDLESKGFTKEAYQLDVVANTLDIMNNRDEIKNLSDQELEKRIKELEKDIRNNTWGDRPPTGFHEQHFKMDLGEKVDRLDEELRDLKYESYLRDRMKNKK